ncbi:MAG: 4-(cytidine 5'-diphospho)-2-C-methyl-D-erythritol kinase [Candidatus Omnitrophica bacterium]|nr:4-(cytidine 5'-diphospho)-2-C-methyl-D-erythritol kinase [Candidatus Omnitrophota bacterium]
MSQLILKAPAKLNLYLKVINKRPDGYHNIVTLFERIDLFDRIRLNSNSSGKITVTCNHPQVPTGPKNLVHKVAKMIKEKYQIAEGIHIDIDKSIPVAAGLAGGSTNAATVLLGLNKLWKLNLSQAKMVDIASQIGSDVPFFLYDSSWALGTDRGTHIKPLKIKRELWHILVVPKIKMQTPKVYSRIRIPTKTGFPKGGKVNNTNMLTKKDDDVNILVHKLRKSNIISISSLLYNDLEKVVVQICPKIMKLKETLKSLNAKGVTVSGSGPSVYGLTDSRQEALQIHSQLSKRYSQVFVVRTL